MSPGPSAGVTSPLIMSFACGGVFWSPAVTRRSVTSYDTPLIVYVFVSPSRIVSMTASRISVNLMRPRLSTIVDMIV